MVHWHMSWSDTTTMDAPAALVRAADDQGSRSDCGSGQRYAAPLRVENAGFMGRAEQQAAPPGHRKEHRHDHHA
jgi:hypothetical protein